MITRSESVPLYRENHQSFFLTVKNFDSPDARDLTGTAVK
jgi:hypothetical protein